MSKFKELLDQLQDYKFENGLTNRQLADMLEVNHTYLSEIFNGRTPGPRLVFKIKRLLAAKS